MNCTHCKRSIHEANIRFQLIGYPIEVITLEEKDGLEERGFHNNNELGQALDVVEV